MAESDDHEPAQWRSRIDCGVPESHQQLGGGMKFCTVGNGRKIHEANEDYSATACLYRAHEDYHGDLTPREGPVTCLNCQDPPESSWKRGG
jgi:hypothetical protein